MWPVEIFGIGARGARYRREAQGAVREQSDGQDTSRRRRVRSGSRRTVRAQAGGAGRGQRAGGIQGTSRRRRVWSGSRRAIRAQAGGAGCGQSAGGQSEHNPRSCRRRTPVRECPIRRRVSGKIRPSTRSGAGRPVTSTACARYADPGRHTAPDSTPRRPAAHTP